MKRVVTLLGLFTASLFLIVGLPGATFADAVLIPLDGSQNVDPATFGYTVNVGVLNEHASIEILLTAEAAKAFRTAYLTLTKNGKNVLITSLGLVGTEGGKKRLRILFRNTDIVDGGEIIIWSSSVGEKTVPRKNFGGFRLSIETLLAKARKREEDVKDEATPTEEQPNKPNAPDKK